MNLDNIIIDEQDKHLLEKYTWHRLTNGHLATTLNTTKGQRTIPLHQFICVTDMLVDHANGDLNDYSRKNLRPATSSQNNSNRGMSKNNTSGFKGVTRNTPNSWRAKVICNKQQFVMGYFPTPEEAARAYDEGARIHHKEFARLNFPRIGERGLDGKVVI